MQVSLIYLSHLICDLECYFDFNDTWLKKHKTKIVYYIRNKILKIYTCKCKTILLVLYFELIQMLMLSYKTQLWHSNATVGEKDY